MHTGRAAPIDPYLMLPSSSHIWFAALLLLVASLGASAQTDPDSTATPKLTFGAFADVYYLYDLLEPADNQRPGFVYARAQPPQ